MATQQSFNDRKIQAYFSHLVSTLHVRKDVHSVVVAHMVPNTLFFLPAIASLTTLTAVLPKPKSTVRPEYKIIAKRYRTEELHREWASDGKAVSKLLHGLGLAGKEIVLVDIGGYFAESVDTIVEHFNGKLLGVLEGTENGVQKYEKSLPAKALLATVARSPLKLPEDYLVASSVVFSIEATLREQAEILQTRTAAVIGYGRVGSAVAEILRGRGINTEVFDTDPIKLAEAAARGFQARTQLQSALAAATLVVCATGGKALDLRGFAMLRSGCVVASVTSADDELDLGSLSKGYKREEVSKSITRYSENRDTGRHFFLIAGGNAANFLHGAVIGPAIQLIEGEKLAAISAIMSGDLVSTNNTPLELSADARRRVAEVWNEHFLL